MPHRLTSEALEDRRVDARHLPDLGLEGSEDPMLGRAFEELLDPAVADDPLERGRRAPVVE
jgi:hypothetical protein